MIGKHKHDYRADVLPARSCFFVVRAPRIRSAHGRARWTVFSIADLLSQIINAIAGSPERIGEACSGMDGPGGGHRVASTLAEMISFVENSTHRCHYAVDA